MAESIFEEYHKKQKLESENNNRNNKYNSDIIAMTLSGYSSKAYNFARDVFDKSLPCIKTIANYLKKIDAKPGFQMSSLFLLKDKAEMFDEERKHLLVCLSVDDISIRRMFWQLMLGSL